MKKAKKISCIILFLMALLSVGCSKKNMTNSTDVSSNTKQENVLDDNSYEVESVTTTFQTNVYEEDIDLEITYPQIKRLEDKELQKR